MNESSRTLGTKIGDENWGRILGTNIGDEYWGRILGTNIGDEMVVRILITCASMTIMMIVIIDSEFPVPHRTPSLPDRKQDATTTS